MLPNLFIIYPVDKVHPKVNQVSDFMHVEGCVRNGVTVLFVPLQEEDDGWGQCEETEG